jgi:hypothetical protein
MKDSDAVARGRKARSLGRASEKKEADWWRAQGFEVQVAGRKAQYIGPGRLITVPWDILGRFDILAVYPGWPTAMALVQVTREPFYDKELAPKKGRGAGHGEPLFDWPAPTFGVEEWVGEVQTGSLDGIPAQTQVLVSYAQVRTPDRRWWTKRA